MINYHTFIFKPSDRRTREPVRIGAAKTIMAQQEGAKNVLNCTSDSEEETPDLVWLREYEDKRLQQPKMRRSRFSCKLINLRKRHRRQLATSEPYPAVRLEKLTERTMRIMLEMIFERRWQEGLNQDNIDYEEIHELLKELRSIEGEGKVVLLGGPALDYGTVRPGCVEPDETGKAFQPERQLSMHTVRTPMQKRRRRRTIVAPTDRRLRSHAGEVQHDPAVDHGTVRPGRVETDKPGTAIPGRPVQGMP